MALRLLKGTFAEAASYGDGYGSGYGDGYGYGYGYGDGDGKEANNGIEERVD